MNVNDDACLLIQRGALGFFASKPQAGARSYKFCWQDKRFIA